MKHKPVSVDTAMAGGGRRDAIAKLMRPASIAVVGASADATKYSGRPLAYLAALGFQGAVYPITPAVPEIQGYRCYADIGDVPGPVDVALIARPAINVAAEIRKCLAKGIRAFVVLSGGFAEAGPEGAALQAELVDLCRAAGAVLCGPNCSGLANAPLRATLSFMSNLDREIGDGGTIAIVSNSGSIAAMMFQGRGRVFNAVVSTGNEAVLTSADYIAFAVEDPATRGVVAFIEGIRDPGRFVAAAERADRAGKPLAVLKAGRFTASAKIASSHTGALIDDDAVIDAVFQRHNVIRVNSIDELKSIATLMHAAADRGLGERIAIVTPSGGTAVLLADAMTEHGLTLAPLADATAARVRAIVPNAIVGNPMDVTGFGADAKTLGQVTTIIAADEGVDVILAPLGGAVGSTAAGRAEALIEVTCVSGKLVIPIWQATTADQPGYRHLVEAGLPVFTDYAQACLALARLIRHRQRSRSVKGKSVAARPIGAAAQALIDATLSAPVRNVNEAEVKAILAAVGLAIPCALRLPAAGGIVQAPTGFRYPAVLKVISRDIPHKNVVGGVAFLGAPGELDTTRRQMVETVSARAPLATIEGFLLEEFVMGGIEILVGAKRDPSFGPCLSLGLGGVAANAFRGAATAMLPLTDGEAAALVGRFAPGLAGTGYEKALVDFLLCLGDLAVAFGDRLQVLEVNPVKLTGGMDDARAIALDGLIELDNR